MQTVAKYTTKSLGDVEMCEDKGEFLLRYPSFKQKPLRGDLEFIQRAFIESIRLDLTERWR